MVVVVGAGGWEVVEILSLLLRLIESQAYADAMTWQNDGLQKVQIRKLSG